MGKKKGSKKKGKAKEVVDLTPQLSVPERFIKFQLDTRHEVMELWQNRKMEYHEKNDAARKKVEKLKVRQGVLIGQLRGKSDDAEKEHADKKNLCASQRDGAELRKATAIEDSMRALRDHEAELKKKEQQLREESELLSLLEHHKHVLQAEWAAQVETLEQTIEDLERDFVEEKDSIERQFRLSKLRFEGSVDKKMAKTKRDASDTALDRQPAHDKIAYSDNGWLRHEIAEQQVELERAEVSVDTLRGENEALVAQLFGQIGRATTPGGDGSRGHSAPPSRMSPRPGSIAGGRPGSRGSPAGDPRGRVVAYGSRPSSRGAIRLGRQPESPARGSPSRGGSRPTSRGGSRPVSRARSGWRGAADPMLEVEDFDDEDFDYEQDHDSQVASLGEVIGRLKLFPALAQQGDPLRLVGHVPMRRTRSESGRSLPAVPPSNSMGAMGVH